MVMVAHKQTLLAIITKRAAYEEMFHEVKRRSIPVRTSLQVASMIKTTQLHLRVVAREVPCWFTQKAPLSGTSAPLSSTRSYYIPKSMVPTVLKSKS